MNIKLLKKNDLTKEDCKQLGDQVKNIRLAFDKILKIIPYKYNVDTLDQLMKVYNKFDFIVFLMSEEAIDNKIINEADQNILMRRQD